MSCVSSIRALRTSKVVKLLVMWGLVLGAVIISVWVLAILLSMLDLVLSCRIGILGKVPRSLRVSCWELELMVMKVLLL